MFLWWHLYKSSPELPAQGCCIQDLLIQLREFWSNVHSILSTDSLIMVNISVSPNPSLWIFLLWQSRSAFCLKTILTILMFDMQFAVCCGWQFADPWCALVFQSCFPIWCPYIIDSSILCNFGWLVERVRHVGFGIRHWGPESRCRGVDLFIPSLIGGNWNSFCDRCSAWAGLVLVQKTNVIQQCPGRGSRCRVVNRLIFQSWLQEVWCGPDRDGI